ncbi:hypothetical protein C0J52_16623 [Blattella germanica]|nr:hypothetical protein C0J52_16623 [Blattella germanica]
MFAIIMPKLNNDCSDVIYHNEAYSKSNSSIEASPEKVSANKQSEKPSFDPQRTPSPKRGASFVSAVISAIRNATAGGMAKQGEPQTEEASATPEEVPEEPTQVTEPEKDVEQDRDEIASNPRYSTGSISASCLANSESLQNLSQAILNRQQFELAQAEGSDDIASIEYDSSGVDLLPPLEDCSPAITLVDQIIDVDNLVTKLLKDEVRNWERMGARLRGEVQDVRLQLQRRVQELENTKKELEQHKDQIQVGRKKELTKELNSLSVVCKETEMQLRTHEQEAENVLQQWQQSGQLPSPEILARVITAREEVPVLKKKLAEKEQQLQEIGQKYSLSKQVLTENWTQAATEVRRQYEAIDSALETLHSVQGVVVQCPPLAKLQQDLEETNFQSASSLPLLAADLNANAPPLVTLNGTHNGGNNSTHKSGNTINGTA